MAIVASVAAMAADAAVEEAAVFPVSIVHRHRPGRIWSSGSFSKRMEIQWL